MEFMEGDIVVLYNHTIGRIEEIHGWQPLHDILGLDGYKYHNQLASKLILIKGLNKMTLERLTDWVLIPINFVQFRKHTQFCLNRRS